MPPSVIRRVRPTAKPVEAEPVKIIEPVAEEEAEVPDDGSMESAERSGRAASSRTDYQKVVDDVTARVSNRKTAIRAMCITCMGGMIYEVAKCTSVKCPLYDYRMGENPNDARTIAAKAKREAEATAKAATKPAAAGRARPVRRSR